MVPFRSHQAHQPPKLQGVFRGLGDTKSPLWATIICNGVNVVLDAVFIMYFGWGVTGAAWATIIGQVSVAADILLGSLRTNCNMQCSTTMPKLCSDLSAKKQELVQSLSFVVSKAGRTKQDADTLGLLLAGCGSHRAVCCTWQTLQHIIPGQAGAAECCQVSGSYWYSAAQHPCTHWHLLPVGSDTTLQWLLQMLAICTSTFQDLLSALCYT